jgi:hypothetical protein
VSNLERTEVRTSSFRPVIARVTLRISGACSTAVQRDAAVTPETTVPIEFLPSCVADSLAGVVIVAAVDDVSSVGRVAPGEGPSTSLACEDDGGGNGGEIELHFDVDLITWCELVTCNSVSIRFRMKISESTNKFCRAFGASEERRG